MSNLYGGDEVGAVVFDVGHYSTKVGYSGEDAPKSEISSIVAIHDVPTKLASELDRNESNGNVIGPGSIINRERKYYVDTTAINVPRSGQEIKSFLRDGMIEDWDLFEKMFDYIYARNIMSQSSQHPVMFSEVPWNTKNCREKLTEIMFEKYGIPAFYLAKNAMLCAFSTGRPTGIVLDSGAHHTTATPVVEGHVLQRGIVRTLYGGDYITGMCYKHLTDKQLDIIPYYLVKSKEATTVGQPSKWTRKTNLPDGITPSWHKYMLRDEVKNYKTTVLRVYDSKYDSEEANKMYDPVSYQFPDGLNLEPSVDEQFSIVEPFFDNSFDINKNLSSSGTPTVLPTPSSTSTTTESTPRPSVTTNVSGQLPPPSITYPNIVLSSIAKCDVDIRPSLLSSVILAGGNTLLNGFTERITNELSTLAPQNLRVKVVSNNSYIERRYAAWIGGSILASLGTFQQLWISKLEYEELGKSCIDY